MKKTIFYILLTSFVSSALAQEEELDRMIDKFLFGKELSDSLLTASGIDDSDIAEFISLYSGRSYISVRSDFENKTYFTGQDLGIDQYNIAGQVYYMGSRGLLAGVSGIMYSKFDPKYNTTILTAGYYSRMGRSKSLSIKTLYSRYFFAKVDSIESDSFNNSAALGLTWSGRYGGASADIIMLFGNELSGQFNFTGWGTIPLVRFGLANRLTFDPEVSFLLGNETVVVNQYVSFPRFTGEIYSEQTTFGLRNTSLRLPLTLEIGSFDFSAGYNLNFPRIPGSTEKPGTTSFFNISVGYIFML